MFPYQPASQLFIAILLLVSPTLELGHVDGLGDIGNIGFPILHNLQHWRWQRIIMSFRQEGYERRNTHHPDTGNWRNTDEQRPGCHHLSRDANAIPCASAG